MAPMAGASCISPFCRSTILTNRWFITNLVGVGGAAREAYLAKHDAYFGQRAAMGPAEDLAREAMEGRVRF
jgi:hypothetical protein